ncbi:hypothetical protein [Chitinophaga arvensicola]|uniref:Uncharacterized protein n=1 Tax=Chitinophaga arvensicola TaxID=29529 RepID=A0A1I0S9A0_9BACT|nr:hypothetical protein [Chitinophaga arvensicola]SEW52704.1 hypothetical protein SAMN04488122_5044 [Chitinophaga arvensicola]
MNNESFNQEDERKSLFQRLRGSMFPVQPTDKVPVRLLKDSAFYLFAVMALLVTLLLGGAIMFVL